MSADPRRDPRIVRLTYASVAGSLLMTTALVVVHVTSGSQLALAQAADSLSDVLSGSALVWAVRQASRPPDAEHPTGHSRAEPLAALAVALLAGVLSVEVFRTAVVALVTGATAIIDWPVAGVFALKIVFRFVIVVVAGVVLARKANPAVAALRVDARNDMLVGGVSLLGVVLARWKLPALDSWLAIGLAIYIGVSGFRLARENLGLVMGEAVASARHEELVRIAADVDGVVTVDEVVATWAGSLIDVDIDIGVDGTTSVSKAHAIAHAVEARLQSEEDVARVIVHVNPATPRDAPQ